MGIIETIKLITREEALEEGLERGRYETVKILLQNSDFEAEKIASLASVSMSFVNKVKQDLGITE